MKNLLFPGTYSRYCFPFFLALFSFLPGVPLSGAESGIRPVRLTCEYMNNPSVTDALQPRLSWINKVVNPGERGQKQTAWQVRVASSPEKLLAGEADLWDSGKQVSEQLSLIKYGGQALRPAQDCWWQVRVWDAGGNLSGWSEMACWGMGLTDSSGWKAKWIGAPWQGEEAREDLPGRPHVPVPVLRRIFDLNKNVV
jgi:alpha-L-rhamnosidase